jgi:hypothetical protein
MSTHGDELFRVFHRAGHGRADRPVVVALVDPEVFCGRGKPELDAHVVGFGGERASEDVAVHPDPVDLEVKHRSQESHGDPKGTLVAREAQRELF